MAVAALAAHEGKSVGMLIDSKNSYADSTLWLLDLKNPSDS